eukprot:gene5476-11016_t
MLDYDNSAFYYFALTLLCFYLIPGLWFAVSEILAAFGGTKDPSLSARTAVEKDKATKLRKGNTGLARLRKWPFLINLAILIIALSIFFYLISLVQNDGEVNRFDPYQILGIDVGMPAGEIKKAYRKLSLKYHPDKNSGDKFAEEMFMKVAKAYESLTDETARENYEKYGNPDGKQALEVSIGLPRIILDNPKFVLVFYLIAMVVLIPAAVGLWYANSKQYGEKNVMYETYTAFYQLLTENHRLKMLPEIIAASAECRKINVPNEEHREALGKVYGKMKADKLMQKPKIEHPTILTGNLLLHTHLMRMTDMLTPGLRKDLDKMLSVCPELIEGMIEIAHQRRWLQTTLSCIRFSQCLIQGLWHSDHSLMQLPHFTETELKHVTRGAKVQAKTLSEYLRVEDAEKKGLAKFNDEEKKDVLSVCNILPRIKVDLKLFVEEEDDNESVAGDDDTPLPVTDTKATADANATATVSVPAPSVSGDAIYEQDLVTLRITIVRENVAEGESAPPVHAPLFPKPLREGWWILLADKPKTTSEKKDKEKNGGEQSSGGLANIHAVEKITDQSRVVVHEVRFLAPAKAGDYAMDLLLCSDCYLGLDEELEVKFTVLPAADLPEYEAHKEDLELDNDPTLFEMMMTAGADDSSDDEDDDEEEEDLTDAQKKRREQRRAKKGVKGGEVEAEKEDDADEQDDGDDEDDDNDDDEDS